MDPALLGVVLDSSVFIAAERRKRTPAQAVESVQQKVGEIPIVLSPLTVAEIGHGIYRAATPIQPVTEAAAEIIARIGGEQAAKGINLPLGDLIIGATAMELGYAIATSNLRDFNRIPGLRVVQV